MKRNHLSTDCLWSLGTLLSLIVVDSTIYRSSTERSAYFQAFEGHVLQHHVCASYQVTTALECASNCLRNSACLSYNYRPISSEHNECQLNDANKATCPECYVVQPDFIYYDDAQINNCNGRDGELPNYDLYFPNKSLTSFVNQTWFLNLNMFTICFWMQTADTEIGVPFSYASSNALNEVTIFKWNLAIGDVESKKTNLGAYYDGSRHHVCATWESTTGNWNVTVDGTVINNGSGFQANHTIPGGGYLVIGQDQDSTPGDPNGFQWNQSFIGSISGMNVWSTVLPYDEILRISKTCNMGSGDVLKWSDFMISRHGDVVVKSPSTCKIW